MNLVMRMYSTILTQITPDVNILPTQKFVNPNAMLEVIEPEAALDLVNDGEANLLASIHRIRNCIQIGLKIDSLIGDCPTMTTFMSAITSAKASFDTTDVQNTNEKTA